MEQRDDIDRHQSDERTAGRADLLPEEEAAGSDDARAQAEAILDESDQRSEDRDRDATAGSEVEHRTSDQATAPS